MVSLRAGRRLDVELLRVIGLVGVITIHSTGSSIGAGPATDYGFSYWLALSVNALARVSVPLFLAVAGWAQLSRSPQASEGYWLVRRLRRLIVPLLFWSAIYLLEEIGLSLRHGAPPWPVGGLEHWIYIKMRLVLFGPGVKGHLWYMYFLVPMTVVIWLVQATRSAGEQPRGRNAVHGLRSHASLLVVAAAFVGTFGLISAARLPVSWTGFAWTLGYAGIGFAILSSGRLRGRGIAVCVFLAASFAVAVLGRTLGYNTWPYFNQSPIIMIGLVALLWAVAGADLRPWAERWRPLILATGGLTYGAYMVHFLVLNVAQIVLAGLDAAVPIPGPAKVVGLITVTTLGSIGIAALWHRSSRLAAALG